MYRKLWSDHVESLFSVGVINWCNVSLWRPFLKRLHGHHVVSFCQFQGVFSQKAYNELWFVDFCTPMVTKSHEGVRWWTHNLTKFKTSFFDDATVRLQPSLGIWKSSWTSLFIPLSPKRVWTSSMFFFFYQCRICFMGHQWPNRM